MTNDVSEKERGQSLLWRNRELWGHGLVWGAISAGVAIQREDSIPTLIGAIVTGTLVGCYIGYLFKSYRQGKEGSEETS